MHNISQLKGKNKILNSLNIQQNEQNSTANIFLDNQVLYFI